MVGYNAYSGMNNYGGFNNNQNNYGMYNNVPAQNYQMPAQVGQVGSDGLPYVHGIEGAYAFPMPQGISKIILWDDTNDSFYIKGYDNMGKPKVLAWNDFVPHSEPEKKETTVTTNVDTSNFVTKEYLDHVIKQLSVGERGRIVIASEHDA